MQEPHRQFLTISLGPVIQALYASPDTAGMMHYHERTTAQILKYAQTNGRMLKEYNDTTCGYNYLDAVKTGKINWTSQLPHPLPLHLLPHQTLIYYLW
jgi:hypothetical protein